MNYLRLLVLPLILTFNTNVRSQDIPPPNPDLVINIVSGQSIEFVFDEIDEWINGIMNAGHITHIRVGSIYNWKLQFKADQTIFYGTMNPSNTMLLNNVGLVILSTGTNQDDGSNIVNYAKTDPVALESTDVTVLTKGSLDNKGYGIRNSFLLNWEMGTMRGNMNNQSIFEQAVPGDIYTLNIVLTLSVY